MGRRTMTKTMAQSTDHCWRWRATTALACQELNTPLYFNGRERSSRRATTSVLPTTGLTLRFRAPDRAGARGAATRSATRVGYDMDVPWVSRDKVHIELLLPGHEHSVRRRRASFNVLVDGATEYTQVRLRRPSSRWRWADDDPIILPPDARRCRDTLRAGASYSGIVREDDFARASWTWMRSGAGTDADRRARRSRAC